MPARGGDPAAPPCRAHTRRRRGPCGRRRCGPCRTREDVDLCLEVGDAACQSRDGDEGALSLRLGSVGANRAGVVLAVADRVVVTQPARRLRDPVPGGGLGVGWHAGDAVDGGLDVGADAPNDEGRAATASRPEKPAMMDTVFPLKVILYVF